MGTIIRNGIIYGGGSAGLLPHLVIEADPSSTVTVSKGQTSITATETSSGIYECDVAEFGTYTINGTLNGASVEGTLVVDTVMVYNYAFTIPVPEGATVTPVNDIQTWLKCAGLDKEYTTLAEVLVDEETFDILLRDSNACDYMARSTTWALAENSVPAMTDATHPSGEVICDVEDSSYLGYYVFDKNTSTFWATGIQTDNHFVGYKFASPVIITRFEINVYRDNTGLQIKDYKIQGSNDNSSWTDLYNGTAPSDATNNALISGVFSNDTAYQYYRLYILNSYVGYIAIREVQFFEADITTNQSAMQRIGRYDYCSEKLLSNSTWASAIVESDYREEILTTSVPIMTSATAPSGEVRASSIYASGREGWKAFSKGYDDGTTNTMWVGNPSNYTDEWLEYIFPEAISIKAVTLSLLTGKTNSNCRNGSYKLQASDNGTTYKDIATIPFTKSTGGGTAGVDNNEAHRYWRIKTVTSNWVTNDYPNGYTQFAYVQFYGRKSISSTYYPLVPAMTDATHPSGEVIASATTSGYDAYKAFDGNRTTFVLPNSGLSATDFYIAYHSPQKFAVDKAVIEACTSRSTDPVKDVYYDLILQGSNDGEEWTNITSSAVRVQYTSQSSGYDGKEFVLEGDNSTQYEYFRIKCSNSNYPYAHDSGRYAITVGEVQFYEKITKGVIHSAPNDTIYTLDENLEPVILCYTNGEGIGELDYADFGAKNVRFYSSVAKDLTDLTKDFSKIFQITNTIYGGTTELYLMPDTFFIKKLLYWWGYKGSTLGSPKNKGYVSASLSENTNDLTVTVTSSSYQSNCGYLIPFDDAFDVTDMTKFKAILEVPSNSMTYAFARVGLFDTKPTSVVAPNTDVGTNRIGANEVLSKAIYSKDISLSGDKYFAMYSAGDSSTYMLGQPNTSIVMKFYAIWLE